MVEEFLTIQWTNPPTFVSEMSQLPDIISFSDGRICSVDEG